MISAMIVIFAITAIAGITLAALHFGKKKLPIGIVVSHGVFAVTGLILLIMSVVKMTAMGALSYALACIVLAALGGLTLFFGFYLRKKNLPTPIVGIHALFAVAGFMLIIVHAIPH